jgi:transcriptional regulator with XRE-family HTH domain
MSNNLGNKQIMANNIKRYMREQNKTRNDVCSALDLKYSTFTEWINAKKYPRIDKIELLANYFGIEKSDLVEDKKGKEEMLKEFYSSATPQQKVNMQRKTLDDVKGWFDENTYNLLENYLDCDDKGKQLANDRLTELVKLYPKENK